MTRHYALTGGIGAGKSTVAKMLTERGAALIDADVLARRVVEPGTPALARIAQEFGDGVLGASGELDRAALADIVFADDSALAALNAIVHPAVREASRELKTRLITEGKHEVIIEDIPLLAESSGAREFDGVIVVHTPIELRLRRLQDRGMSMSEARARIDAQASDSQRLAIADFVIHNDGTLSELNEQVESLWRESLRPQTN